MKRFVFRLESVLRIRAFELERARRMLAALEKERRVRADSVVDSTKRLDLGRAWLLADAAEGTDADRLALRADGVSVGRLRLAHAQHLLGELDAPLRQAKEHVQKSRARVRSLERLREHRADEHRRESLSIEQRELEELAMVRLSGDRNLARRRAEVSS